MNISRFKNRNISAKSRKTSLIYAILALTGITTCMAPDGFTEAVENAFIRQLKEKLTSYNKHLPEDRIYLQTDKPLYEPGDDLWFSGYIRKGQNLKASTQSEIVYVELISPKGNVEKKLNLIAKNGKVAGDFSFDKELPGGIYKLKAYTNWMKNEGENTAFEKEIQVQDVVLPNLKMKLEFEKKAFGPGDQVSARLELNTNENKALANHKLKFVVNIAGTGILEQADVTDEDGMRYLKFNLPKELKSNDGLLNVMIDYNGNTESISRSIPIVLNKIELSVFPEGGDLVNGLESQVAFRALNEFGKPADIEGVVLTEKGSRVTSFSSFHQGMGAFKITPQPGERYKIKITKPEGISQETYLPEVYERGYVLTIDNSKSERINAIVQSTEKEELSLVAQVRGKIVYATSINAAGGTHTITFSTAQIPAGVCQVTLFDSKGIARAERLTFANRDKQLQISLETEKEKYLPRDKVKMTISVKDERGLPMPAFLSLAVVNDQLLSFADDKSGNILSQLLLQQDLREKVEEPAFYFNKKEAKSATALDYLLMTSGWRRFTWEKILEEELPPIKFTSEKTIVAGKVFNSLNNKPIENAKIKTSDGREFTTDENGNYNISKIDLTENITFTFTAEGLMPQQQQITNYQDNLNVYLYDQSYFQRQVFSEAVMVNEVEMQMAQVAGSADIVVAENFKGIRLKKARATSSKEIQAKDNKPENKKLPVLPKKGVNVLDDVAFEQKEMPAEDLRFGAPVHKNLNLSAGVVAQQTLYYRTRQFPAPRYEKQQNVETRSDFRNTIYWNPGIEIGHSGKKTIEFYTSDDITSFRATIEGVSSDGTIGRCEKNFFTQLPFAMSTKVPLEVATEDLLTIPVTLKNNTGEPLGGLISVNAPEGLIATQKVNPVQTIMPGVARTVLFTYKVSDKIGEGDFNVSFKACGMGDAFTQKIKIVAKGFPVQASFSGKEKEKEYRFTLNNMVSGSLRASFSAYPNVVSDLLKGVEGILQEPYGCFEQTSCTAYPNAMVLDYLKHTGSNDSKTLARATDLLDRGYKRLVTFEASNKGYEWFGANPGHEGLTAYGIMEFMDMKRAGQEVDEKMLDRTARWLINHKDGKGGFQREQHAYHDFGRISDEVLNAYIVYALADAGYTDIKKEFETSFDNAVNKKDPYLLAMIANAAFDLKEKDKGKQALKLLLSQQQKDGSFTGAQHSITYSQGQSLIIETTALSILAILADSDKNVNALNDAVQFLVSIRSGSGVFGSTQGTVLSLKCLTEYAKFSKQTKEDGTIAIYIDNKKVAERNYKAGEKSVIELAGLEKFISGEGQHSIKVKYLDTKDALPYSVSVNWNTFLPQSDEACSIDIKSTLSSKTVSVGETVRLKTIISNRKNHEVPSTMAIIGIPAGFSAQPWQLKDLQEKKLVDYYEIKGNNIAVYYRGLGPGAVKEINLDLKAELPGEYEAPASSAYLYYTNEYKTWCASGKVNIKKAG